MNPSSTPDQTEKLAALQAYEAPPLKSEYDGFICDMALQHGAVMLNDEGSTYAFTQEQLLDFTKANRVPTQAVPEVAQNNPTTLAPVPVGSPGEFAAFEKEFEKLGYQWSNSNLEKAYLGWRLAKTSAREQVIESFEGWAIRELKVPSLDHLKDKVYSHAFVAAMELAWNAARRTGNLAAPPTPAESRDSSSTTKEQ